MLRGGSFINNATNLRSANRNNNQPGNRDNNNGFRVASTLRQAFGCLSGQNPRAVDVDFPQSVQVQSPGRRPVSGCIRFGQIENPPGGTGRPQGSNAPPGTFHYWGGQFTRFSCAIKLRWVRSDTRQLALKSISSTASIAPSLCLSVIQRI